MKTEDDLKIINFIKKNPDFVKRNRAYFSGLLNDLNNSKKILPLDLARQKKNEYNISKINELDTKIKSLIKNAKTNYKLQLLLIDYLCNSLKLKNLKQTIKYSYSFLKQEFKNTEIEIFLIDEIKSQKVLEPKEEKEIIKYVNNIFLNKKARKVKKNEDILNVLVKLLKNNKYEPGNLVFCSMGKEYPFGFILFSYKNKDFRGELDYLFQLSHVISCSYARFI
tara:strand:+ start:443 stop:1111 length:669 start_codon:yes stop_codon:yes gene_type:complete